MKTFTDSQGEQWQIATLTVRSIRAIRDRLDLCLAPLYPDDVKPVAGDEKKPTKEQMNRLRADLARLNDDKNGELASVLWLLCEEQAKSRGLAPEEFAERIGDFTAYFEAVRALDEELTLFFLSHRHKPAAENLLTKRREKTSAILAEEQQKAIQEMAQEISPASSSTASGSAESAASTLTTSPGVNSNGWPTGG